MKYMTIVKCELCGKQGTVLVDSNNTVNNALNGEVLNGFTRKPAVNQDWKLMCEECNMKNDALLEAQKIERKDFLEGTKQNEM